MGKSSKSYSVLADNGNFAIDGTKNNSWLTLDINAKRGLIFLR